MRECFCGGPPPLRSPNCPLVFADSAAATSVKYNFSMECGEAQQVALVHEPRRGARRFIPHGSGEPCAVVREIVDEVLRHWQLTLQAPLAVERSRGRGPMADRIREDRKSAGVQPRGQRVPQPGRVPHCTSSGRRGKIGHQWASGNVFGHCVPPLARAIGADARLVAPHSCPPSPPPPPHPTPPC